MYSITDILSPKFSWHCVWGEFPLYDSLCWNGGILTLWPIFPSVYFATVLPSSCYTLLTQRFANNILTSCCSLPPVLSLQHKFLLSYSRSISSAHKHLLFQAAHPFVFAESVCSPFLQERKRSRFCPGFVSLCWKCTTTTTTTPRVLEKNPSWAPTCILNELLAP